MLLTVVGCDLTGSDGMVITFTLELFTSMSFPFSHVI